MLKSHSKGLFVDVSEFSILIAKTSGYSHPIVLEELTQIELGADQTPDTIRAFFEDFVDFKGRGFYISRCGVKPSGRFVRYYEAESVAKVKDSRVLTEVLRSDFGVNPESNNVSILDAHDGSDFDFSQAKTKQLLFCGAPHESLQAKQDELLSFGLYPDRMELSSITSLGGVADYSRFARLDAPVLCLELTSANANICVVNRGRIDVARPVSFGLDSIYPLLQRELGLKDEASARKLFFSNTFDFTEMGAKLLRRLIKELQASTGFYEVQTGQSIDRLYLSYMPKNFSWVGTTIAEALGLEILQPKFEDWLSSLDVTAGEGVELLHLESGWLDLFSQMGEFQMRGDS